MSENANISGKKLFKVAVSKSLGVVLASLGVSVLLVGAVPMMPQFVHEDVEQYKRPRLLLGKAANNVIVAKVARDAEALEKMAMFLEVGSRQLRPQVLVPSVKENSSRLLAVVELMVAIMDATDRQNDALEAVG